MNEVVSKKVLSRTPWRDSLAFTPAALTLLTPYIKDTSFVLMYHSQENSSVTLRCFTEHSLELLAVLVFTRTTLEDQPALDCQRDLSRCDIPGVVWPDENLECAALGFSYEARWAYLLTKAFDAYFPHLRIN